MGNDKSDTNADEGVKSTYGAGFVKLASWTATRHGDYRKFIIRVQRYVTAVMCAEKEERMKGKKIDKALLGYDPDKWVL